MNENQEQQPSTPQERVLQACPQHRVPVIGILCVSAEGEIVHLFVCPIPGCPIPTPFNQAQKQNIVLPNGPINLQDFARRQNPYTN